MMTHQARIYAEELRSKAAASPVCNSARVSRAGLVSVRDASGSVRAAKLDVGALLALELEARAARHALVAAERGIRRAS